MSGGDQVTISMTRDELSQIIRTAVRAELDHIGLMVEEADHVSEAREDFRFVRRLRLAIDKTSGIVGKVIVTAIVAAVLAAIAKGFSIAR
ncbi:Haemolysin XhlA OS=Bosea thiooxidans OX=53254 GN=SAMN05660750_03308 PE=4 SV=1 [Bosea thiooxidans]|uniref:Uncharacterized protein n=1 Tax=Bosea thiooxidans TaxID=53254 RepID=A0A1T5FKK5_9HYPH|nr:hypothetical protein [Bosea thiooxidans]SKB96731.1 hypothetical protein SAMN05660750_03308 [Bosea thiooxidans]